MKRLFTKKQHTTSYEIIIKYPNQEEITKYSRTLYKAKNIAKDAYNCGAESVYAEKHRWWSGYKSREWGFWWENILIFKPKDKTFKCNSVVKHKFVNI